MSKSPIIKLENLYVDFPVKGGLPFQKKKHISAVSDVSLEIYPGETFGIVGESGCGKSTLANAMIGMVNPTGGKVIFKGIDLFSLSRTDFKKTRSDMQMIFQDPFSSFPIEFPIENLLPGAQIQFPVGDSHHSLPAHDLAFEMRIGIVLKAIMGILGMGLFGSQFFQPFLEIRVQAGFIVIDEDRCCDMHRIHQAKAFADPAIAQAFFDLLGNVYKLPALCGVKPQFTAIGFHQMMGDFSIMEARSVGVSYTS